MKIIAMYLPQFHETKENNEWWGQGYTDWTAVQNAEPLFEGHRQPRIPADGQYYDLMKRESFVKQEQLMKKYGVDGFCFYHYYFKNGRKVLEKPLENLLEWKDIDIPFCLSWASQSWTRTWSKWMSGNYWASKYEPKSKASAEVLLQQEYGREREWKEHFEYLLPFFKDERYIRINGKPIFILYDASMITCVHAMMDYWRSLAKKEGIPGIYFMCENTKNSNCGCDAILYHGIRFEGQEFVYNQGIQQYSYDKLWENDLNRLPYEKIDTYYEGFVDFDNTPRNGEKGKVVVGGTPEKFGNYMYKLMQKSKKQGNDIVFVNAWNEWGEGMYLEPDQEMGTGWLEELYKAKKKIDGESVEKEDDICRQASGLNKKRETVICLHKWLLRQEQGRKIEEFLVMHHYKNVAVYGAGIIGKHLLTELQNTEIHISCVIDRRNDIDELDYRFITPDQSVDNVDAVVITVAREFDDIYESIKDKWSCPIISIMELVE